MNRRIWIIVGLFLCPFSVAWAQQFSITKVTPADRAKANGIRANTSPSSQTTVSASSARDPGRVITVAKGDILSDIARHVTGSSENWPKIARYNNLANADDLNEGMLLRIPSELILAANSGVQVPTNSVAVDTTEKLDLFAGEIVVLDAPLVERVAVGNGRVVRAEVLASDELLVIAEAQGSSSVRLWHQDGSQTDYNFRVTETDPETRFHMEKMVNFKVKMVEFRKSALNSLGINWADNAAGPALAAAGDLISNPLFRPQSDALATSLPNSVKPFSGYFGIASSLTSQINLMSSQGDAVLLAEPTLSCANGSSAKFLAGGEVPYPTVGANGQPRIDFKEYGIKLEISPRIDTEGNVQTHVLAEISSIDPAVSVQGAPGLLTRRTQTQINVRSGQTIVIGGLLQSDNSRDIDRLPGISRLPIIGRLFQSRNLRRNVSELVVFITPEVVSPGLDKQTEHQNKIEVFSANRLSQGARQLLIEAMQ